MCCFLPQLGFIEAHLRRLEIGAGILEVRIEEERVEPPVEIVVVRGIVAGTGPVVRDVHAPGQAAEAGQDVREPARTRVLFVRQDQREEIVDRPVLDGEAAVHERFAELHLRVEDDGALDGGRGKADRDGRRAAVAEAMDLARRIDDRERAHANRRIEECAQQPVHRPRHQCVEAARARGRDRQPVRPISLPGRSRIAPTCRAIAAVRHGRAG